MTDFLLDAGLAGAVAAPAAAAARMALDVAHDPVLRVENLGVAFRAGAAWTPVIHDVSFEVRAGETLAIVGESGSGKSVTALAILRLLDDRDCRVGGRIALGGRDLLALPEIAMGQVRGNEVAMIFQEPMTSLNPVLTVGVQLAESLVFHQGLDWKAARAEAVRLLDRVRIPAAAARYDEYPHRFSGGMRQRAMIAMALACRPRLLIADEPTTALDVTIQADVLDLIRDLQAEQGTSVLFITHDMGVVAEVADRTIVMHRGRVVESGATARVFAEPARPYTRSLLAAVPQLGSMAGEVRPRPFALVDPDTGEASEAAVLRDTVSRDAAPVLRVQGLSTGFDVRSGWLGRVTGRVHAVQDVSFDLQPGETLALVGESGSGKSTIARSILGLARASEGRVSVDGVDLAGLDAAALRRMRTRMQMIFQDPAASLDPRQTVGSALTEALLAHGLARRDELPAILERLLLQVGLEPAMAARHPHEFSGGQRQRLCIARALALAPRLMIADEAVSALDVSIKAQVINLMLSLQEQLGLAYLFISHDLAVVERVSHRVAVLHHGQIVEIGPRAAIFASPQHAYTRRLLASVPVPDPARRGTRHRLAGEEPGHVVRPLGWQPPASRLLEVGPGHFARRPVDGIA